ncbi:MAG TPA: hypothetical protein VF585_07415 [Chthoniobacterales bacterium]|jgi:hypothetical protein
MNPITKTLVIAASLLLAACQTGPTAFVAGSTPDQLIHRASGFSFPPHVGAFARVDATQYDTTGQDVSVGYNSGVLIAATVYVYPAGGRSLETEFASRRAEILASHSGASAIGQRTITVTPRRISARVASFSYAGIFARTRQQLGSELVLALHGDKFVKYRFTYPASHADRASAEINQFTRSFSWL